MTALSEDTHAGLERAEEELSWIGLAVAGTLRAAELAVIALTDGAGRFRPGRLADAAPGGPRAGEALRQA